MPTADVPHVIMVMEVIPFLQCYICEPCMGLRLPSLQIRVCVSYALPYFELCGLADSLLPMLVQCFVCLTVRLVATLLFLRYLVLVSFAS